MSTIAPTSSPTSTASLATSTTFRTFAIVFAIATPILYVICELRNWPLFTYHPGTGRIDLFWAPAVRNEGPAMHWYGWTANTVIGAGVLGLLATLLPEQIAKRIPLSLVWILPLAAIPILTYGLKFYWRW